VGFGVYGVNQIHQRMDQLKVSDTSKLSELVGVTGATVEDDSSVAVKYVVAEGTPYATVTHLRGQNTAKVSIVKTGDTAAITIKDEGTCEYSEYECNSLSRVTIYGPQLSQLTVGHGGLDYQTAKTNDLNVSVNSEAQLVLHGSVVSLTANVDDLATLSASDVAVQRVTLTMATSADVDFGTVSDLALSVPTACAVGRHGQLSTEGISRFTVNGQTASITGHHYDANTPCLLINHW
ncbi:MAG TPA: DUF2807 domain-containing protein, partial [Candidatus Saccharimonadales bacterium]|nr:DUF2807 domain-containing protein [Candidatus Saccharimonadales bacterium]